jgi:hypothetical protein
MKKMSTPLKLSSLQTKEIHVQNSLIFRNPGVMLTGSITKLLFNRVDTLEEEVADLYANGGGGGGSSAIEVYFPSVTAHGYEDLLVQLMHTNTNPEVPYNSFGRFAFTSLESNLQQEAFPLPAANSQSHFRILNETDLTVFPIDTSLVLKYTNSDLTEGYYSMSSELISARNPDGNWVFYSGS